MVWIIYASRERSFPDAVVITPHDMLHLIYKVVFNKKIYDLRHANLN